MFQKSASRKAKSCRVGRGVGVERIVLVGYLARTWPLWWQRSDQEIHERGHNFSHLSHCFVYFLIQISVATE
jgi:hypothetical protein